MDRQRLTGIQLDLKYQMPNKAYMLEWVKRLSDYGIDTLLIEYEDKFPFEKYPFVRAADAFTPEELTTFLDTARSAGLTLVPLVQTFAHLEFCLAHEQLAHLRDQPHVLPKICASREESVVFVKDLIDDVLAYHGPDKLIHLGGDEVWHTNWCEACQKRIDEVGPARFWCDHERKLIEHVMAAGKRPIVWDDIFWDKPETIRDCDLPKEVILHAWNYSITELGAGKSGSAGMEWGGGDNTLPQVDIYHDAGYASLAAPCYNIGQLFTHHTKSLGNTRAWAQKIHQANMHGMINTAWACFHMPLVSTNLHIAATAELCADPDAPVLDAAWQEQWLGNEFGCDASGAAAAFETLGQGLGLPLPKGYGRNFSAMVYSYMNMVLHYPNGHKDRRTQGPYPLDWDEMDFAAMYLKGIEEGAKSEKLPELLEKLNDLTAAMDPAVAALEGLASRATKHRDEAEALAVLARLKLTSARILAFMLTGAGDGAVLAGELAGQKEAVSSTLARCFEPASARRMMRVYYDQLANALAARLEEPAGRS